MNIIVLYNPKSGPDTLNINEFQSNILKTFNSEVNQKFEIEFINIIDSDFNKKLDDINLKIVKAIIIAGGDGTISSNIDLLVKNDILLGILPLGTFNNFAKDNGIPNNLREALKIIKDFNFTEIDVGKLNNIYFINNSSIGLYTRSVKLREKTKKKYNINKITAMAIAALRVFHIFPMIHLEVKTEEVQWKRKTPFVFIGNNNYDFDLFNLGSRDSLSQGKLFIYYSKCKHRICLLSIAIKALFGMLTNEKDFISKPVTEVVIDSRKKRISVAADGELYEMNLPLKYKIIPKAVKLVVPKK